MSHNERQQWEQDLMIAGWRQSVPGGLWYHPAVGGLHNLISAIRELQKAID